MSLLDTALRFAEYKPEPFVAPIPTQGIVDVFTMQNNVPLRYTLRNQPVGWWNIVPKKHGAVLGEPAWEYEKLEYLSELPRFYAIACVPSGENCWLIFPYNASDASQRGWKNGEPKQVYLVDERIEPFDLIMVRSLAGVMLYQGADYRLGENEKSEQFRNAIDRKIPQYGGQSWGNAYDLVLGWQKKIEQEEIRKNLSSKLMSITERMRFMLEFMGADLVSAEKMGNGYQVIWTAPDGHTYKMGVREDGRIAVAGFCLAGTDSLHNLSSIVQVMEEAHKRERPDVEQAYADYDPDEDDDD